MILHYHAPKLNKVAVKLRMHKSKGPKQAPGPLMNDRIQGK